LHSALPKQGRQNSWLNLNPQAAYPFEIFQSPVAMRRKPHLLFDAMNAHLITLAILFWETTMKKLITLAASALFVTSVAVAAQASTDMSSGEKVFRKCKSCHSLEEGKKRIGPSLYGVFGRTAGTAEGYKYSSAMTAYGVVWDDASLKTFLESPRTVVKGTKMGFAGLKNPADIDALLSYLHEELSEEDD
jgi:cytochrome c